MQAIAYYVNRLSLGLNVVALALAVGAVAIMLGAAGWQVVARYLLSQPPAWTEELARFSMVWGGLLGASCAFRNKTDPTLFPDALALRGTVGRILVLTRSAGVLCFVLPILWYCFFGPGANPARGYLVRLSGRQAETMDLPMIVFGVAIPLAFSIIVIHVMADMAAIFTHKKKEEVVT